MDIKLIKAASENGSLFYEKLGTSDGKCDICGKRGWSHLIAIIENESEANGQIQNAEHIWSCGSECFKKISQKFQMKPFRSLN
jgi:hypothetical protein